jgi:ABC-2 type transport system permease protein
VSKQKSARILTLVERELLEYRTSLLLAPLLIALALAGLMLVSVLLANQINALGESVQQLVLQKSDTNVSIRIEDNGGDKPSIEYTVEQKQPLPGAGNSNGSTVAAPPVAADKEPSTRSGSLNPLLNGVHNLFLFILILVCGNYLLATLFTDRRDRSILFWKSMPVSERDEVLSKFGVAMVVAPALFVAASLLAQVACMLLAMLLVWRMDLDPYQLILGNLDFGALITGQMAGVLLMTIWIAPTYAWLLLASAAARRSPFMTAAAPIIGLLLLERIVFGSSYLIALFTRYIPHYGGGSSAGFYWLGMQDVPGMLLGLLITVAALWAAIYLRRYRFEI